MSNDSNEQDNDTTAQAFQVGDRVMVIPSDGTTGRVVSLPYVLASALLRNGGIAVVLDVTSDVLVFRADNLAHIGPDASEPATPAPAQPARDLAPWKLPRLADLPQRWR